MARDFLAHLPSEIQVHIFSFLDLKALGQAATVNSSWNSVAQYKGLWHNQHLTLTGKTGGKDPRGRLQQICERFPFAAAEGISLSNRGSLVQISSEDNASTFRTACAPWRPIRRNTGVHLWTLSIEASVHDDGVMIGVVDQPNRYYSDGFDSTPFGWAFYSRGKSFHHSGLGEPYGEAFKRGDVVGVLVDTVADRLGFFKNGKYLGTAFSKLFAEDSNRILYPAVGLAHYGNRVRVLTYRSSKSLAAFGAGDRNSRLGRLVKQEHKLAKKQIKTNAKEAKLKAKQRAAKLGEAQKKTAVAASAALSAKNCGQQYYSSFSSTGSLQEGMGFSLAIRL